MFLMIRNIMKRFFFSIEAIHNVIF